MRIGPLSLLTLTSDRRVLSVASWHSPHSLTWRWSLSLIPQRIGKLKPIFHASKISEHRFFAVGLGALALFTANKNNNGWQFQIALFWLLLNFAQQPPMWYRDIYMRERDRELEEDFASQAPVPVTTLPEHRTLQ